MKRIPLLVFLMLWITLAACTEAAPTQDVPGQTGTDLEGAVDEPLVTAALETPVQEQVETPLATSAPLAPMEVSEPETGDLPELPPCSGSPTSPNMEGPYYTAGSPQRTSLIDPGMPGIPIVILGRVFDQDCSPIPGAMVDFWQADMNGVYDNDGYTLRGYAITAEDGSYSMETIEPGPYTGRPPHIHVKVFDSQGRELLTTQMYFPGSEGAQDVASAPDLLVSYSGQDEAGRQLVFFNFVVAE